MLQYRQHLLDEGKAPSTINIALSAIRKLAEEAETHGYLSEREAAHIRRIDGVPMRGVRFGNWLNKEQALELLTKPDQNKNAGLRDFVLLGLLLGCGLRREEAIGVRCEQIVDRDGRLVLLDIVGKGRKLRTVVIPRWLEDPIRTWMQQIRDSGLLLRRVSSEDNISESGITGEALRLIIKKYAGELGLKITPHDLRRTFALGATMGGANPVSVQQALGHASLTTTTRYVASAQALQDPACDHFL